jgi:hypothetical protein
MMFLQKNSLSGRRIFSGHLPLKPIEKLLIKISENFIFIVKESKEPPKSP